MKRNLLSAAISTALVTGNVHAGDADFFVFLGNSPAEGVEIAINGEVIGATDNQGAANAYIDESGIQTITLLENGETLATAEVEIDSEQDLEMSVVLSTSDAAEINIFTTGGNVGGEIVDGYLRGQITDADGNPLSGAEVRAIGTDYSTTAAEDGTYNLDLPRGIYDFIFSADGFNARSVSEIRIVSNIGTGAVVKLTDSSTASVTPAPLEEMLILGRLSADDGDSFTVEQMASTVIDAIDMEQIARFGDSNVASAIKRVVGVTIIDDKYAVVRGLNGRYIAATLNEMVMPTTNAFIRDAELDLFPSNVLGGIEIQKNFSANKPADSTAGAILVKTQDMPYEYKHKLGIDIGYNPSVTGEDLVSFDGPGEDIPATVYNATNGGRDFTICTPGFAFGDCVEEEEAAAIAGELPNKWNLGSKTAKPDAGLSYAIGNNFDIFSVYTAIDYKESSDSKVDAFVDSQFENTGSYSDDSFKTSLNAFLVMGIDVDGHKIQSKTQFLSEDKETARFFDVFNNPEDPRLVGIHIRNPRTRSPNSAFSR